MRRGFDELAQLRIEIPEAHRAQHCAAIAEELRVIPEPEQKRVWSRRAAVAVLTVAMLLPTAVIASESSIPGDFLYPVKQAIEPLQMLFDGEVKARHRVNELESLVDSNAATDIVDRQVERARDALADVDAPGLQRRFDRAVDRISERRPVGDQPQFPEPPDGEGDGPTTTIAETDEPSPQDSGAVDPGRDRVTTSTTTEPGDGDGRPPSDRPSDEG